MKRTVILLVLSCVSAVLVLFYWNDIKPGPLFRLRYDLDRAADAVYETGKDATVGSSVPGGDPMIVISPPYYPIRKEKIPDITGDVLDKMHREVGRAETGHIFYIQGGKIKDHRLLTGLASPVFGYSSGNTTKFLISREERSARPVKIEIIR